ncbi:glutaminase [Candidatus Nitronereus thalassa]|uniref:Glutaminase n=1 Tax=Candidatus Nitronereus thalassa TaxID=3020898 RepID=A0ABU3K3T3_9BACT|nr:glutaminase [Candidatus Nitronereus thalassa]MDT7041036.1 glutaminase [Candidatus Nitronereus thalassa]
MDYQKVFSEMAAEVDYIEDHGKVPSYIPELQNVDPNKFGIHLTTIDGQNFYLGDSNEKFSIQSIAKVFSLVLAFGLEDDRLWERVGVEPSGTPFNSLVQLEYEKGIPRNPFINAGALVICDILVSRLEHPKREILDFVRGVSGNPAIEYCSRVAESEKLTSFTNAALINLMKAYSNIHNDIDVVLDVYFHLCSIEMTCQELAQGLLFLANNGVNPFAEKRVVSESKSKRINAIMQLCGFYDEAGEFSFKVGLPGKSGVGGGIIAIYPGHYSIAVWSPKLNAKGNSYKGMRILEFLTTRTKASIF